MMEVEAQDEGKNSDNKPVLKNDQTKKGEERSMTANSAERQVNDKDGNGNRKARVGMMFESEESAKSFYGAYARHVGFSIDVCQFNLHGCIYNTVELTNVDAKSYMSCICTIK